MKATKYYILIIILIYLGQTNTRYINKNDWGKWTNLNKTTQKEQLEYGTMTPLYRQCAHIADCYNCTVSSCVWDDNKCVPYSGADIWIDEIKNVDNPQGTYGLQMQQFFKYGQFCTDYLDLCQVDDTQSYTQTILHLRQNVNQEIPSNYFCIWNLTQSSSRYQVLGQIPNITVTYPQINANKDALSQVVFGRWNNSYGQLEYLEDKFGNGYYSNYVSGNYTLNITGQSKDQIIGFINKYPYKSDNALYQPSLKIAITHDAWYNILSELFFGFFIIAIFSGGTKLCFWIEKQKKEIKDKDKTDDKQKQKVVINLSDNLLIQSNKDLRLTNGAMVFESEYIGLGDSVNVKTIVEPQTMEQDASERGTLAYKELLSNPEKNSYALESQGSPRGGTKIDISNQQSLKFNNVDYLAMPTIVETEPTQKIKANADLSGIKKKNKQKKL